MAGKISPIDRIRKIFDIALDNSSDLLEAMFAQEQSLSSFLFTFDFFKIKDIKIINQWATDEVYLIKKTL